MGKMKPKKVPFGTVPKKYFKTHTGLLRQSAPSEELVVAKREREEMEKAKKRKKGGQ